MGEVIKFPEVANTNQAEARGVSMTLRREQNGKTVITNLMNLSDEEFLMVLIGDAAMKEKQDLAKKYISS